jgi:hypothetical protein
VCRDPGDRQHGADGRSRAGEDRQAAIQTDMSARGRFLVTKKERDIVSFLASLTSPDYREPGIKELARQRALFRATRPQRDTARAVGPKPPRPQPPGL